MPKRIKKSPVGPERRRQWLKRLEEDGETQLQIAKTDGFDVRTVRKQIELARQEREIREARSMVLRRALEEHYADLVSFAQQLEHALVESLPALLADRSNRMWFALREHLPRSSVWKDTERWEHLQREVRRLSEECSRRLLGELESSPDVKLASNPNKVGLNVPGLRYAIEDRLISLAKEGTVPVGEFFVSTRQDGLVTLAYHKGWHCATVPPEKVPEVEELIRELMKRVGEQPEYAGMERTQAELPKVRGKLLDELATIRLRRVVPGRCRYCPI